MSAARQSRDLAAVVALALLGTAAALLGLDGWLRGIASLPLALFLPGYALTAALFPPRTIPAAERTVYVAVMGLAAAALSGLVVQLALRLDSDVWAVSLLLLTLAASWLAHRRRAIQSSESASTWTHLPLPGRLSVALVLAALGICAWSVAIASNRARDERRDEHFTELWVVPHKKGVGRGRQLTAAIGVSNHQGHAQNYRVRVSDGAKALAGWRIQLAENASWEATLPVSRVGPARPLAVTLLHAGHVYRRVYLKGEPPS